MLPNGPFIGLRVTVTEWHSDRHPRVLSIGVGEIFLWLIFLILAPEHQTKADDLGTQELLTQGNSKEPIVTVGDSQKENLTSQQLKKKFENLCKFYKNNHCKFGPKCKQDHTKFCKNVVKHGIAKHDKNGCKISQGRKCPECSTSIAAHTEGPTWFVMCNMCNDDWNIDHRRWSKRCLLTSGDHKKKNGCDGKCEKLHPNAKVLQFSPNSRRNQFSNGMLRFPFLFLHRLIQYLLTNDISFTLLIQPWWLCGRVVDW